MADRTWLVRMASYTDSLRQRGKETAHKGKQNAMPASAFPVKLEAEDAGGGGGKRGRSHHALQSPAMRQELPKEAPTGLYHEFQPH